jgi:hypothetical protein
MHDKGAEVAARLRPGTEWFVTGKTGGPSHQT